jgi:hypothetical protein
MISHPARLMRKEAHGSREAAKVVKGSRLALRSGRWSDLIDPS